MIATLIASCAMTVTLVIPRPPVDADALLLECIAQVETGKRATVHGTQMGRAAWRDHQTPREHLTWIRQTMVAAGYVPTPYLLALCWNAGVARVQARDELKRHQNYASRVRNLFDEMLANAKKDK